MQRFFDNRGLRQETYPSSALPDQKSFLDKYGRSPAQANYPNSPVSPTTSPTSSALLDQNSFLETEAGALRNNLTGMGQQLADTQTANAELQKQLDATQENVTGPGRTMSNVLAGGTLGLGIASFLDNRKTAKLQRSAMKENLQMARDDQAARKRRTAGWANAFGGNE